jgi:membrane-bound lytic murein transglycosylase D
LGFAAIFTLNLSVFAEDEELFDQLYDMGAQFTEDYLPDGIEETLNLPSYEDWKFFWQQITDALHSGSFEDLAWIQPEVEEALRYLQAIPATRPYADWLMQRLDYCDMAQYAVKAVPVEKAKPMVRPRTPTRRIIAPPSPTKPVVSQTVNQRRSSVVQNPQLWKKKLSSRPKPKQADVLVPKLKKVFASEGVPTQWVWLAEVESSMNPNAKSPVGAKGLFQFMPATAKRFGLKLSPVDERTIPEKSARAAAQYLRILHKQFGDWPLVLAAYNAGEGRVGKLLKKHQTKSFEKISPDLSVETRMYVPKVMATVELREGINPATLPAPKRMASLHSGTNSRRTALSRNIGTLVVGCQWRSKTEVLLCGGSSLNSDLMDTQA